MLTTFVLTVIGYLRKLAEIVVVGFVVAGVINAVVNKEAVARYLGGSPVVANLLGATIGLVDAHHQRALGRERRHQQDEEDAAGAQTRPDGTVQDALRGLERRQVTEADGAQRGADHPLG